MATTMKEQDEIQSKIRLETLLRRTIKPCKCLSQHGFCMEDYMTYRREMTKKCVHDEKSHDEFIRSKLANSIESISPNKRFIKFKLEIVLNPNNSNVGMIFCRDCFCDLTCLGLRTLENRVSELKLRLFHDNVGVQQTAGQVPFNTSRSDNAPFESLQAASAFNKSSKSDYIRRELQLLTVKPSEHDVFEWCERHLFLIGN